MAREWKPRDFDSLYERFICSEEYGFGGRAYYRRYRARFKEAMKKAAELLPDHPVNILDIGGGQMALLAHKLWGDRVMAADLDAPHMAYIRAQGVETVAWNLCDETIPELARFDFVFFLEVIEHLPMAGYIIFDRIKQVMKPGGILLCTTPNLYRIRNLVYMALGKKIFDNFQLPTDSALSHVIEYSQEHLEWQLRKAGFANIAVELTRMHHWPTNPLHRPLAAIGYPLHLVPHWRDTLVAVGRAPVASELAGSKRLNDSV